jgi:hypothetical protein
MANRFDRFFNVKREEMRVKGIAKEIIHGTPAKKKKLKKIFGQR